jgi:ribonuclease BN (tRNA processing enzyme)
MADVQVRFLGSGDAFGSGGRFQTCILVESGSTRALIDCGASSLIAMKRDGVDPGAIDAILLSHLHGDHFGGIPFLLLDAQFSRRTRPLVVAGPPGLEERIVTTMEALFPGSSRTPRRFDLQFVELAERISHPLGALAVTAFGVAHASGAPSYALRLVLDGAVIAYSGDTEWTDALLAAAAGSDLFICEAYFFEKQVKYHLDYRTLAGHRPRLDCRRLVLTHMSAEMLDRRAEVDADCAEDGLIIAL